MTIGEDDWIALNAYADGELEAKEAQLLRRRLKAEPGLREELARIEAAKRGLAGLRPAAAPSLPPQQPARRRSPLWSLAAAITLLVAAGFAAYSLLVVSQPEVKLAEVKLADLEEPQPPVQEAAEALAPAADMASGSRIGAIGAPDLSASNLELTEMALRREGGEESVSMRYLGPNGCRVTLVARAPDRAPPPLTAELSAAWQTERAHYSLTAEGMDPARFAAIAAYAEAQVRAADQQEALRLALVDTTAEAEPCA